MMVAPVRLLIQPAHTGGFLVPVGANVVIVVVLAAAWFLAFLGFCLRQGGGFLPVYGLFLPVLVRVGDDTPASQIGGLRGSAERSAVGAFAA